MNFLWSHLLHTHLHNLINHACTNRIPFRCFYKLRNLTRISQDPSVGNPGSPKSQYPHTLPATEQYKNTHHEKQSENKETKHKNSHDGKPTENKGTTRKNTRYRKPTKIKETKLEKNFGFGKDDQVRNQQQIELSGQQKNILIAISRGQSVFFTGAAGTGKTSLLHHCIRILKKIHGQDSVFVTASTGIAASALNGTTLHSFAGIGKGFGDVESLVSKVRGSQGKFRWKKAKALVIDEISMIDGDLFDKLNYISKIFSTQKKMGREFGGLQLVVTGDFCQLPPIKPSNLGKIFAFQADCWDKCFDMQTELTNIYRQPDLEFMKMLNEFRKGICSAESIETLRTCQELPKIDDGITFTKLYPLKFDVTRENEQKMKELGKEIFTFYAEDSGSEHARSQLDNMLVLKELSLCVGAQVILTYNINTEKGLVNGRMGVVQGFQLDNSQTSRSAITPKGVWPVVKFKDFHQCKTIKPQRYEVLDFDENGKVIIAAKRVQVPLILAWALSVHKSQGMTLDRIETDLTNAFDCGMVYVALSRLRKLEGLRLLGFHPSKVIAHPEVLEFYEKLGKRTE